MENIESDIDSNSTPSKEVEADEAIKNSPGGKNGNAEASITLTEEKLSVYRVI